MGAKWMMVYPNVKHCYQNNWTVLRKGCNTPIYHYIDYLGRTCVYLFSTIILIMALIFWRVIVWYKKKLTSKQSGESSSHIQIPQIEPSA